MTKRKMHPKALRAFHANQDMKTRCYGCGRRVEPEKTIVFDEIAEAVEMFICPFCGDEMEPPGKWDKDVQS